MQSDLTDVDRVWIFHGEGAVFASAVFRSEADGRAWAARHGMTGILAEYPVGDGCYDIAVREGRFRPSKDHHGSAHHVARFGPGLGHVHLRNGHPDLGSGHGEMAAADRRTGQAKSTSDTPNST